MSNVAFGGDWSEELMTERKLSAVIADLEWAVENCIECDVLTPCVIQSLEYINDTVEKGPMHVSAFKRAANIQIPNIRHAQLSKVVMRIKSWI